MSSSFDFDRQITAWLDEQAPMRAPDPIAESALARTRRTRQLPGWATLERWIPMETRYKFGAVPRTAIILTILAILLAVLSAIAVGQQPSTKLQSALPSEVAIAPTPHPSCYNPYPWGGDCLGQLSAGTYTTTQFAVPITYTVPDGWNNEADTSDHFQLLPEGQTGEDYIGIFLSLYPATQDCTSRSEPSVGRSAKALADWMAGFPGLKTGGALPVSVGGLDGYYVDMTIDPAWTKTCPYSNGQPMVDLLVGEGGFDHWIVPHDAARYYFLDANGSPLVIEVYYTPRAKTFEEYLAWVTPVIEDMSFQTQ